MKYITIPVDDPVYEVLAQQAAKVEEPELAMYVRDFLRAHVRKAHEPVVMPQVVGVNQCPLDLALPGVYGVRNKVQKRMYIGSARSIARRVAQHVRDLRLGKHHNSGLQADWSKDGEGAFEWGVFDLLPDASKDRLLEREHIWIDRMWKLKGHSALYNQRIEYSRMPSWSQDRSAK